MITENKNAAGLPTALFNTYPNYNLTKPDMQAEALSLAKKGVSVFPAGCCKSPLIPNGHNAASGNFNVLKDRWERFPNANIGIPTGHKNGFWVLDIDGLD